jgi:bifunctional non-homologous end joining protein LigD
VAFDRLDKDSEDLRPLRLDERKRRLAYLVSKVRGGIEFGAHIEGNGADIFRAACTLGHEGIVAKRKDLPYESGRSKGWLKIKNPDRAAMQRVRDEAF